MKTKWITLLLQILITTILHAQVDSTSIEEDEEDFSKYATAELASGGKRYCTSKVFDLSPNKLFSLSYDYQGAHKLTNYGLNTANAKGIDTATSTIKGMGGIRLGANIPVISKTNVLWSVGATYWRMNYNFDNPETQNYFTNALYQRGLTTMGLNTTLFKPFNERQFVLAFVSADANGDYTFGDTKLFDYLSNPTYTIAGFYGVKRNDRSILAFGVSRTYRAGNQTIFPLILWNHTFENRKWGVEMLLPSRLNIRRNFNPRTLLFVGYEMEGNSYSLLNRTPDPYYDNYLLRRSEVRPRITFEKSIFGFVWLSMQAGYRLNFRYNIDETDFFRALGDEDNYKELNDLSNAWYFTVGIHLVSP
jgi:hypothetical protein